MGSCIYIFPPLQVFYFIGFGLFCLESVLSIWVIQVNCSLYLPISLPFSREKEYTQMIIGACILLVQQVYMYFRGSGKAAEMKREAARGTLRAAF